MYSDMDEMKVIKRDGTYENISFDKILTRCKKLGNNITPILNINYGQFIIKIIEQLYNNISTNQIDELTAEQSATLTSTNYDYNILASRVVISNHHKSTLSNFSKTMKKLYEFKDINGINKPIINSNILLLCEKYSDELENMIDYNRDYLIDYFGFKTLEKSYLLRLNNIIVERPQHMWMRVALCIHKDNLKLVKETYDLMSEKYFTHATPTLYNAGTNKEQLSSCYLISMENDSIEGIYNTLKECANISKWAGGIGLNIHNIRASGSHIRGTNGKSNGIVPMLRVFNMTARYVDQGGGKRNGSFAIYIEPWHADINDFLELKKNHGDEEMRARDLFYGLWIPSLFMTKVHNNEDWYLFCPDSAPKLSELYGDEFDSLYNEYVDKKIYKKKIKARDLWFKILDCQMETGTPYLLYKDNANIKSNQNNLGTIRSSNLCTEIIEYSDENQTAVCNLASIGLPKYVENKEFNYEKLHEVVEIVTKNLNNIIDINFYPTIKTKVSNLLHRPIGIGVQGFADTLALMNIPFYSNEAKEVNIKIFETIYHASLTSSNNIAKSRNIMMKKIIKCHNENNIFDYKPEKLKVERSYNQDNIKNIKNEIEFCNPIPDELSFENYDENLDFYGSYSSFEGSLTHKGKLQFDLWNITPGNRYNWDELKNNIIKYGLRNSLLVAPMPTASTSQILGNNECFEPFTSNIYTRRTMAGEFILVNKHLLSELSELKLWNIELKNKIIKDKGSVQKIDSIPQHIKNKYKTVWEIPMKHLIDMAAERGPYICQSQSLNLWMENPNYKSLTAMHFYSWKKGLKTGIYYLRRKSRHQAQQFTINPDEICDTCSS
jgi:ribonucleoside-diphosphate reductase alpha chain